jgi:hypothetical protein
MTHPFYLTFSTKKKKLGKMKQKPRVFFGGFWFFGVFFLGGFFWGGGSRTKKRG